MSANINSIAVAGEAAWHKQGIQVPNAMTAQEAITLGGLDWNVDLSEVIVNGKVAEGYKATVRSDTKETLGIVKGRYVPLQNRHAFSLFDAIVGEKLAIYQTVGALGKGERIWLLAKLPGEIRVIGDDITEKYLLLANSHDGSLKVTVMFTPIRVVCQNTLNGALASDETRAKIKHTATMGLKIDKVRDVLGIVNRQYSLFGELSQKLAVTSLTQDAFQTYAKRTLGIKDVPEGEEMPTRTENILDKVSELFETGKGTELHGVRGTAWAGYNAITEYVDFHRTTKGSAENRTQSLLFGSGADIKERAWNNAIELVR